MISVVKVKHDEVAAGGPARLFRSDRAGLADGAQARDFIWVGDVVEVMLWLLDNAGGQRPVQPRHRAGAHLSRIWRTRCATRPGKPRRIEYIDMPASLRGQYQSFTEAPMERLRAAGYAGQFTPLEEGIRRYVQDHLAPARPLSLMIPSCCFPQFDPVAGPARAARAYAGMRWPISPAWWSAGGWCGAWCGCRPWSPRRCRWTTS